MWSWERGLDRHFCIVRYDVHEIDRGEWREGVWEA